MNRTLKTCLLWLLIAVMPFQAFAANALRACGSGHQGMSMAAAGAMDHGDASTSVHDAAMDPQAGDAGPCPDTASDTAPDTVSSHDLRNDTAPSGEHGSCSACAACSVGALAPPQLSSFKPAFNRAEVYVIPGSMPVAGFIPDSLDRPPRHPAA